MSTEFHVKKAFEKSLMNNEQKEEFVKCAIDPLYFIEHYVYIKTDRGREIFPLYDYQRNLIKTYNDFKYTIAMAGRQQGKSINATTIITHNQKQVKIGSLIKLNFRDKLVNWLEQLLIKLSK
jgi:hypothetical protein